MNLDLIVLEVDEVDQYFDWVSKFTSCLPNLRTLTITIELRPHIDEAPSALFESVLAAFGRFSSMAQLQELKIYHSNYTENSTVMTIVPEGLLATWSPATGLEFLVTVEELRERTEAEEATAEGDSEA